MILHRFSDRQDYQEVLSLLGVKLSKTSIFEFGIAAMYSKYTTTLPLCETNLKNHHYPTIKLREGGCLAYVRLTMSQKNLPSTMIAFLIDNGQLTMENY
jgi:hypothetical protein